MILESSVEYKIKDRVQEKIFKIRYWQRCTWAIGKWITLEYSKRKEESKEQNFSECLFYMRQKKVLCKIIKKQYVYSLFLLLMLKGC